MAQYPSEIYTPRARENRSGVVYDAGKKTVWFKEDADAIENEIIAIETDLETNVKFDNTNYNVFLGKEVFKNAAGIQNIGIGYRAGYNNDITGSGSEGDSNIYIGSWAGYGATSGVKNTGYENVAIGAYTLYYNTSGFQNIAIGLFAGMQNTEGQYNVAIGYAALQNNLVGTSNFALGSGALYNNTSHGNVAIGRNALYSQTTGWCNMGIGTFSLWYKQAGDYNVAIGIYAGYGSALHNKSYNTYIGAETGKIHHGSSCVFVGFRAGYRQTTNNNLLIIDNQDRGSAANEQANALIYGVFAAAAANQTLQFNASIFLPIIKVGATQAAAGAAANELWKTSGHATLPDNVVMIGV